MPGPASTSWCGTGLPTWKPRLRTPSWTGIGWGVFWALLFLCHQGKVELDQQGGLFGPLHLRRLLHPGETRQLPLVPALAAAEQVLAA